LIGVGAPLDRVRVSPGKFFDMVKGIHGEYDVHVSFGSGTCSPLAFKYI
jgi:hypothetical protein